MKRIYLLLLTILLIGADNAFAQSDLVLIHPNLKNGDTILYHNPSITGRIIRWRFKNLGPNPITMSDTIKLKVPYTSSQFNGVWSLHFNAQVPGIPVGDSVSFTDTVWFTSAPTSNPFNWCDSLWAVAQGGAVVADPNIANNKECLSIKFMQDPASVEDLVSNANTMGIYPNPATTNITVAYNFAGNSTASLAIRDLTGKTVYSKNLGDKLSGIKQFPVDISNLVSGLYLVELSVNDVKVVGKITVQ